MAVPPVSMWWQIPTATAALRRWARTWSWALWAVTDQSGNHFSSAGSAWPPKKSSAMANSGCAEPPGGQNTSMAGSPCAFFMRRKTGNRTHLQAAWIYLDSANDSRCAGPPTPSSNRPPSECKSTRGRLSIRPPGSFSVPLRPLADGAERGPEGFSHKKKVIVRPTWAAASRQGEHQITSHQASGPFHSPKTALFLLNRERTAPRKAAPRRLGTGPAWAMAGGEERPHTSIHNSRLSQRVFTNPVQMLPSCGLADCSPHLKTFPEWRAAQEIVRPGRSAGGEPWPGNAPPAPALLQRFPGPSHQLQ